MLISDIRRQPRLVDTQVIIHILCAMLHRTSVANCQDNATKSDIFVIEFRVLILIVFILSLTLFLFGEHNDDDKGKKTCHYCRPSFLLYMFCNICSP